MTEALTTAITTCTTVVGDVLTIITGNAVAMVFLAFSVLGGGVGLWHKIKHA